MEYYPTTLNVWRQKNNNIETNVLLRLYREFLKVYAVIMLNKGTEWFKSFEMLSIPLNSTITNPNLDRRKKVGAGHERDIYRNKLK